MGRTLPLGADGYGTTDLRALTKGRGAREMEGWVFDASGGRIEGAERQGRQRATSARERCEVSPSAQAMPKLTSLLELYVAGWVSGL